MIINSACKLPDFFKAWRIEIKSTGATPIEFNALIKSFKLLLAGISTKLPGALLIVISAFSKPTVAPSAKLFGWETSFVVETVTVILPWATAAGSSLTSAPITTVPVLSFTTTLAFS